MSGLMSNHEWTRTLTSDALVTSTKVIEKIADHERGLLLKYLRITGLHVGVILNFMHRKLEWERIAL